MAERIESCRDLRYESHIVSKLSDSDAEQAETQHWLDTALNCKYIRSEVHASLLEKCQEVGRMLGTMIKQTLIILPSIFKMIFCHLPGGLTWNW